MARIGILHGTENWGQTKRARTEYTPDDWEAWSRAEGFASKRIAIQEMSTIDGGGWFDAVINPFGESYPEEDPKEETSLTRLVEYMERGGVFVCTGGWPFYYATSPSGTIPDGRRLRRHFHVDVNSEQWWEDFEPVRQPPESIMKYGALMHADGDSRVHVWRPIREEYGAVEQVLVASGRDGIVLGLLPTGEGAAVFCGMALRGSSEFDKVSSFLEHLLRRGPTAWE